MTRFTPRRFALAKQVPAGSSAQHWVRTRIVARAWGDRPSRDDRVTGPFDLGARILDLFAGGGMLTIDNGSAMFLTGGAGADHVTLGASNDVLSGGAGTNYLNGGDGIDRGTWTSQVHADLLGQRTS